MNCYTTAYLNINSVWLEYNQLPDQLPISNIGGRGGGGGGEEKARKSLELYDLCIDDHQSTPGI